MPELKLLGMFAGSALMFHFSKTLFTTARTSPEFRSNYAVEPSFST